MQQENIGLSGHIIRTIHRANGDVEVWENHNTISSELTQKVNDNLRGYSAYGTDALHNGNATLPPDNEDGIAIQSGSTWYEMDTAVSEPSSESSKWTATFTGTAVTIASSSDVALGFDWDTSDYTVRFANPTSWSSITLGSADTLTIEWTITVS